jgi:hypothetical protein
MIARSGIRALVAKVSTGFIAYCASIVLITLVFLMVLLVFSSKGTPPLLKNNETQAATALTRSHLPAPGGGVHGFVVAALSEQPEQEQQRLLRLPNVRVYLKEQIFPPNGAVGPTVVTDPHGWYILPKHAPGVYNLCVEASGFIPTCDPAAIVITNETFHPSQDVGIAPVPGILQGRVLLKDGNVCFHENSFFTTLQTTTVSLLDPGGVTTVAGPVLANSLGEYVLPQIPGPGSYLFEAECAGAKVTQPVTLTSAHLAGAIPLDFSLPNSVPTISLVVATLGGTAVRTAAPGDTVVVTATAQDPDGDLLHYQWGDRVGGVVSVDSPTVNWTLQSAEAANILFVQVTDNRGGFALDSVTVTTSQAGALFAGRVSETDSFDGGPIADAAVSVNGEVVTTNSDGAFQVTVPESERYVLNVKKPGYALLSQIFYAGTTGLDLRLDRSHRETCNPTRGCSVGDKKREKGARVLIEANTLVDRKGKPATTPVAVDIYTYDLNQPNAIPGDYSAIDSEGGDVTMESYGAVAVDITDAANNRYTLAPGKTALISLAVDPAQLAGAPATIPLWAYNEATGYWEEKAQATLNGNRYEGQVPSFSVWNIDTTFVDAACIRATVDTKRIQLPFKLRVTIPTGPGLSKVQEFPVTEKYNGLFRLPPGENIVLDILPNTGPSVVLKTFNINSGGSVPDPFPPFPYTACLGSVTLALDLPAYDKQWLSRKGKGSLTEATAYYNAIGAIPAKDTFAKWKTANGFDSGGDAVAYYYNAGDLGLGREMHCKQVGANVACYVTNYGKPLFPPASDPAASIAAAIAGNDPIATVAMEYAAGGGGGAVQFYVYNNVGSLAPQAELDSEGLKNVPHICLSCHGGNYIESTQTVEGASFREFDVFSFLYDEVTGFNLANQQEAFRRLNAMVKATSPNSANANNPIVNLIDGMYPCGVNTSGCAASNSYVPPGWSTPGQSALYNTIPKIYCRACHIAQASYIDWTQYSQFTTFSNQIQRAACTTRDMPHAEVPFRKFWFSTDPHAPAYLADPVTGLNFPGGCPP